MQEFDLPRVAWKFSEDRERVSCPRTGWREYNFGPGGRQTGAKTSASSILPPGHPSSSHGGPGQSGSAASDVTALRLRLEAWNSRRSVRQDLETLLTPTLASR